jgi:uncharacterized protein YbbC (DUF1343 family)
MLRGLDEVLVDLQDVGCRVYTFAHTLSLLMERAAELGTGVTILDRPNPIGGAEREGNLLDPDCASFVGLHPIPMRHGLTLGELSLFIASRLKKPLSLSIIPLRGWSRSDYFGDTGLPWVAPSPNMPSPQTAHIYPGTVLFEGTNVSEGRGTTLPFHLIGAPFIDSGRLKREMDGFQLPGVRFREARFQPCFHKWAGEVCGGVEVRPLDKSFKPLLTGLSLLEAILRLWPEEFGLKEPPYEYEFERRPIDLILGRKSVFDALLAGGSAAGLYRGFQKELDGFGKSVQKFLLYP